MRRITPDGKCHRALHIGNGSGQAVRQSFKENYYPEQELAAAVEKKSRHAAPWLRRVIAGATVLVLVVCIPITARALDWEKLWGIFAQWAKETFSFVSGEDTKITEPIKDNDDKFYSMQDMLKRSNRDPSIVPTWLPDGFVFQEAEKLLTPVKENYYAINTTTSLQHFQK